MTSVVRAISDGNSYQEVQVSSFVSLHSQNVGAEKHKANVLHRKLTNPANEHAVMYL